MYETSFSHLFFTQSEKVFQWQREKYNSDQAAQCDERDDWTAAAAADRHSRNHSFNQLGREKNSKNIP